MPNLDRELEASERQVKAMQMRINGEPYREIARKLHYSGAAAACNAVRAALKKTLSEPANELRAIDLARLDDLYKKTLAVMNGKYFLVQGGYVVLNGTKKLEDPDPVLKSVTVLTKILERRATLMGLDAPKVVGVADVNKPDWKRFITGALPEEPALEAPEASQEQDVSNSGIDSSDD